MEALAGAIEPLMREPEKIAAIGEKARARVMEAFNRDREVEEIIAVYDKMWRRTQA